MKIRKASIKDLEAIAEIEQLCFPKEQACSKEEFQKRLFAFSDRFFVMEEEGKIVAFVNGCCSDASILTDAMYHDASLHNAEGAYQMVFGIDTHPAYQRQGIATKLMHYLQDTVQQEQRKGIILTCLEEKIPFYERMDFENQGISISSHGNETWYQMIWRTK